MWTASAPSFWIVVCFAGLGSRAQPLPPFEPVGCVGRRCYIYQMSEFGWERAHASCSQYKGTYLATVRDAIAQNMFTEFVRRKRKRIWIGARDILFQGWTWLNTNENFLGSVREDGHAGCGTINADHGTYEVGGSSCQQWRRYFCARPKVGNNSLPTSELANFYISTNRLPWHSARQECIRKGLDLAVLPGAGTRQAWDFLHNNQDTRVAFWIGLFKRKWTWIGDQTEIVYTNFRNGEPNGADEGCLEMWGDGTWNDENCDTRRPFVCEWQNITVRPVTPATRITSTTTIAQNTSVILPHKGNNAALIGLVVGVVMGVLVLAVILFTFLHAISSRYRSRPKRPRVVIQPRTSHDGKPHLMLRVDDPSSYEQRGLPVDDSVTYDATTQFRFLKINQAESELPSSTLRPPVVEPYVSESTLKAQNIYATSLPTPISNGEPQKQHPYPHRI